MLRLAYLLFVSLLVATSATAQFNLNWERALPAVVADDTLVPAPLLLVGSTGDPYLISRETIVAYQSDGTVRWDAALRGSATDSLHRLATLDPAGNLYVGTNEAIDTVAGQRRGKIRLYKFGPSGQIDWQYVADSLADFWSEEIFAVARDGDEVCACGKARNAPPDTDYYIFAFCLDAATGLVRWREDVRSLLLDATAYRLSFAADGTLVLGGAVTRFVPEAPPRNGYLTSCFDRQRGEITAHSVFDFDMPNQVFREMVLTAAGEIVITGGDFFTALLRIVDLEHEDVAQYVLPDQTPDYSRYHFAHAMKAATANGVVITGRYNDSTALGIDPQILTLRLSAAGERLWRRETGDPTDQYNDIGRDLFLDGLGHVYVLAEREDRAGCCTRLRILKLNEATGELVRDYTEIDRDYHEYPTQLAVVDATAIYVAGVRWEPAGGTTSYFLKKYAEGADSDPDGIEILLYPNPAVDALRVSFRNGVVPNPEIRIYSIDKKLVYREPNYFIGTPIDLSRLPAGSYLVTVYQDETLIGQDILVKR